MRIHRVALIALAVTLLLSIFAVSHARPADVVHFKRAVWVQRLPSNLIQSDSRQMMIIDGTQRYVATYYVIKAREDAANAAAAAYEAAARAVEAATPTPAATATVSSGAAVPGALSFGLFPCIEMAESTNNPNAHSGLYGDLDTTWNGYDGYANAGAAPLYVQNQFNESLYNRLGWRPWNDYCTGT